MSTRFFSEDVELKVLAYCLKSKEFLVEAIRSNPKRSFHRDIHKNLYLMIHHFYKNFNSLLSLESLSEYMKSKNADEAKIVEYKLLYSQIRGLYLQEQDLSFYLDQLKNYHTKRQLYDVFDRGLKDIDSLEGPTVLDNLLHNLSPLKNLSENIPLIERWVYEEVEKRKERYLYRRDHREESRGLIFGFNEIDDVTNGLYPKELAMFLGRTASGKSRILNNIAYNLSKEGEPGILFSLEMYIEQLERLFDSRGSKLSYKKIKKGDLSEEDEAKYFEFLRKVKADRPPLYLVDYSGSCTPSFIQSVVRERKKLGKIKWVCLDYITLMTPDEKWTSETAKYGLLSRELKQIAKAEDIAIITAGQSNRESIKAKTIGTQHISFSDQIAHDCDLIVHLQQSEEQELQNMLEMNIIKYRDGESKVKFEMFVDWDKNYIGNISKITKGEECQTKEMTQVKTLIPTTGLTSTIPKEIKPLF